MALVITASLGPSLVNTIIAIAIPLIPNVARVIRANVLSLRELNYVEAARAVGMRRPRIAAGARVPQHTCPVDRAGDGPVAATAICFRENKAVSASAKKKLAPAKIRIAAIAIPMRFSMPGKPRQKKEKWVTRISQIFTD